jgi:hypothetical protein
MVAAVVAHQGVEAAIFQPPPKKDLRLTQLLLHESIF